VGKSAQKRANRTGQQRHYLNIAVPILHYFVTGRGSIYPGIVQFGPFYSLFDEAHRHIWRMTSHASTATTRRITIPTTTLRKRMRGAESVRPLLPASSSEGGLNQRYRSQRLSGIGDHRSARGKRSKGRFICMAHE
jgi:hypothetical protein